MRVKSRRPPRRVARRRPFCRLSPRRRLLHRGDERIGRRVGQVRDEREHPVVLLRFQQDGAGPEGAHHPLHEGEGGGVGLGARSEEPVAAPEEVGEPGLGPALLGPGHRVAGDEARGVGQLRRQRRHRGLGAADIADDRPRCKARRQGVQHAGVGAQRCRHQHQIRRGQGGGRGVDFVGEAEAGDLGPGRAARIASDDAPPRPRSPKGPCDR